VDLRERARFLADASAALVSSSDYPVTLRQVAELPVPALADVSALDVVGADGAMVRVHVVHGERGSAPRARPLRRPPAKEPALPTLVIPLEVAGRTYGALTLSRTRGDFDEESRAAAEELGRIASLAVAHAESSCQRELVLVRERAAVGEITAQTARLRDLEERRRLALESAAIGTFDYDPVSGALHWDTRCKELFGLPPEASIGYDGFLAAVHADDRDAVTAAVTRVLDPEGPIGFDHEFRAIGVDDGVERWLRAVGQALFDTAGRAIRFLGSVQDVGQRKRIEAELEEARQRSEAANRAKDEFLAVLGHELRNPLAPIRTALDLMRLRQPDALVRERETLERQVQHLVRLVDDLLDVSRITRGRIELSRAPVEVAAVVAHAIEMASPLLERRGHRLSCDVAARGLVVEGDEDRLAQIVANLLTNAARYTDPGGSIEIRAEVRDAQLAISVRDSGIGIAPDVLPRIFELFVQGERRIDHAEGGLGIGLAIARSLAEAHGGRVEAASDGLGKGSVFTLCLPRATATAARQAAAPERPRAADLDAPGPRVLIVDDNHDAAEMLAEALEARGFRTCVAFDAPQALDRAAQFRPHVALLDIGLPVMDGYELARRMREVPELRAVKLVAVTGYGQASDRDRSTQAGFAAHLVKPVALGEVSDLVGSLAEES
jgi:PAS domain S-box-containing protein